MAYTTKTDVRAATGMTDSVKITDTYLDTKIGFADGLINGKIGEVYQLPLSPVPNLIKFFSLEITVAVLFIDQYGENSEDTDKGWKKRLDWLMEQLEDIRLRKTKLFDDTTGAELSLTGVKSPAFYPTATSSDPASSDSTAPQVTMNTQW